MLTRTEEDIVIMEIEEKNDESLLEWVEGKDGTRNSREVEGATEAPAEGAEVVAQTATV